MRRLFACILIAAVSAPSLAQALSEKEASDLLTVTDYLNGECRNGIGDDQKTLKACNMRDVMFTHVKNNGWCYGAPTAPTAKGKWQPCKTTAKKISQAKAPSRQVKPPSRQAKTPRLARRATPRHVTYKHA
ncbi:hypothetical protein [Pseudogulbenkiania ferrooxidans]|uniref:Uncharacterized protein n=1 Tax=Pseudogulbenkiania ferrooxidans 2002 TaxID=279714 RepID=B9YYR0_9NEIS|nr:hypothetical protein [Pseudogulbenkiania ferrooxidans]EEG10263.1 hypothetical protein FuraDRAFT_0245 [Pseudogulbenkiania ferrooxidans 2002]